MPTTSTAAISCRRPWSTAKAACLVAAILAWPAVATAAAEITRRAPDDIAGRDVAAGAEFAARARDDVVTVELGLRGGKRITARIDHAAGTVRLRSLATGPDGAETPAPLDQADLRALGALPREFGELPQGTARDALESLLALLEEAPPGIVLDVDTAAQAPAAAGIRSLCGVKRATGSYTLGDLRVSRRVAVGPCYNEVNECLGRCGRGCGSTSVAGLLEPEHGAAFHPGLLDHDLCAGAPAATSAPARTSSWPPSTTSCSRPTAPRSRAAGPTTWARCGGCVQRAGGSVRGTVTLPRCGRLDVSGRHEGPSVALTASEARSAGCPSRLDYSAVSPAATSSAAPSTVPRRKGGASRAPIDRRQGTLPTGSCWTSWPRSCGRWGVSSVGW